jgi:serine/threonine protein kinase
MEILLNIVAGFVADAVRGNIVSALDWVAARLHRLWREQRDETVQALLENVGCASDEDIRSLVHKQARHPQISAQQREDLVNLLINLAHSARFLTTQALGRSSSAIRTVNMLKQILEGLQTRRKSGERVHPASDWVLDKFLGKGAFGEVWLGYNPHYPEQRAYKFFTNEGALEWIRKEQQTLYHVKQRLGNHANIIEFVDVALGAKPWPYLELEYAPGGNLENWIVSHPDDRLPLNTDRIILDIARGLAKAHGHQIYHRDLKPANILLTDDPLDVQAKVADFGLGRVDSRASGSGSFSLYLSQTLVGTPLYLPPEASWPFHERLPAQDDVFALGVIWYQLLVKHLERPPYDFADRLRQQGVGSETIRLITRCLAQPDSRFKDADELYQAMEGHLIDTWPVPPDCFDVQYLVREYLASQIS